jgi:hypothetical protein
MFLEYTIFMRSADVTNQLQASYFFKAEAKSGGTMSSWLC